ncbi:MAG: hydroxymethylbilane synthase, partial [Qipengyuania sp.]
EWLAIVAILPRAERADVWLGAVSVAQLAPGAVVGTSAPRRAAQLLHARPDCKVVTFRGNVSTRLAKLAAGEVQATFLATAGLERLGEKGVGTRLDPTVWLPAPAQAAIGIECRSDDDRTRELLSAVDHQSSRAEVLGERALLEGLGGSCHSPIAVLSDQARGRIALRAAIYSADGAVRIEEQVEFAADDLDAPRQLGGRMLAEAPEVVASLFGRSL